MAIDRITTGAVLDGAIQTADVANLAIDDTKLAANSVTKEKIAPGAAFVTGMIMPFAGPIANQAAAPSGWLLCDGSEQSATTYPLLKTLLTTTYGAYTNGSGGTGTSHFIIPDLRGRVIAALDNMGGGSAGRISSPEGDLLGNGGNSVAFGSEELTISVDQLPSHSHGSVVNSISQSFKTNTGDGGASVVKSLSISSGATNAGGGQPHSNTQPTMFMNYIIKT